MMYNAEYQLIDADGGSISTFRKASGSGEGSIEYNILVVSSAIWPIVRASAMENNN